ncbi:MFS transporter [Trueperella pyogenes]|uniref:MFS transporter n=1 Tax=Trueperella pyogenes TaxID=1661 RepID=A0A3Q9GJA4_9ACTO|nr:MFS transporter [Trueperella pyogenes]AWG15988.1 MFS transporter [Trueperella pyogenes]AZR04872.1 MFS transporter [Trueperella pyogenes]AZR07483.1 MFS transporter [Trueperella pyogenes]MCI7689457.1 MFS transporter [Trueperella pyogenes]QIU85809.1 MFS transporter [Trueperella pyogenes]
MMAPSLHPQNPRLVWLACAQGMQALAASFLTLALVYYGSARADASGLGLSLAARTAPTLVIALFGGIVADKWNRTKVAAISILVGAGVNAGLAIIIPVSGLDWKAQLLALVAGFATALGAPSLYALLPSVVDKHDLVRANAVVRSWRNTANVIGPGLAASIGALASFEVVLWAIVCLNVGAGLSVLQITLDERAVCPTPVSQELSGITGVLRHNVWLLFAVPFWGLFLAIQSGAADITQPLYVIDKFTPATWSFMMSAMAVGYLVGSLIALKLKPRRLFTGSVFFGALCILQLVATVSSDRLIVLAIASFATGIGFEISGVLWGATLQSRVPEEFMGRVSSFDYAISFGLTPIAYAVFGMFSLEGATFVLSASAWALAGLTVLGIGVGIFLDAARLSAARAKS